ncbi:M14 family metallopeptidase [soil metagenome]
MRSFRQAYLTYAELSEQLDAWVAAYPTLCRLTSLAVTPEGRHVWLLTVGADPDRIRPAAWVDGNMHAAELAGSSCALAIAEDVINLMNGSPNAPELPTAIAARVRDMLFYVVPRISPDGAESVMSTGRSLRSVPRDTRKDRGRPRWVLEDMDGDGSISAMRIRDDGGELVEAPQMPGLLVERTLDDEGPFYKLYPEGRIEHYDGLNIPSPHFLGDNPVDLNRNFPWSWAPHHESIGAGTHAISEPESRGIVEFAVQHPNIFAWCNLHPFGGVLIRPMGHAPDDKMHQEDLAIYRQVEAWMTEHTGYPTVSGYHEFLYEPDKPLRGDIADFAYNQRGALAYTIELWDLFKRLGVEKPPKFAQFYERVTRHQLVQLAWWDRDENGGRAFPPWREVMHPQLGRVEVGGIDPRIGIWNPPEKELSLMCSTQAEVFLRVAALAPRLRVNRVHREAVGDGLVRVDIELLNDGYLGTFGTPSAKTLDFNEPLYATANAIDCTLVEPGQAHQVLGHLDGWGHGLHTGANLPAYPGPRGTTHAAWASYMVRGTGRLSVRAGACRVGFVELDISL